MREIKRLPAAECLEVPTKTSLISLKWRSSHNSHHPSSPTSLALQECEAGPRRSDAQEPGVSEIRADFPQTGPKFSVARARQTESEIISQNRTLTLGNTLYRRFKQ